MSSKRSYSKESRSYYSRSSSFENNRSNSSSSSSYRHRPLSSLLIERDLSFPSVAVDHFDDPFFFERRSRRFLDDFDRRLRSRFDNDLFDEKFFENNSVDFGRNIPIHYQGSNNSSSSIRRNIPVQYTSSSTDRREKVYKNLDNNDNWSSNSFNNDNIKRRENRVSANDWPQKQESPTRKRTSMTIVVRQPRVQYSEVSNHQRTTSTPDYPTTYSTN